MVIRVGYSFLSDVIESYIEEMGITKATADLLTIITIRLNDKIKLMQDTLKED